jgi:hypothetical protein
MLERAINNSKYLVILLIAFGQIGCNTLVSKEKSGVVLARQAKVWSSTAVVAADLRTVERGDKVDIIESDTTEGERWLRVRLYDKGRTEGWIEARNIMPQDMLDRSVDLYREDSGVQTQAIGQLRASTNVRLSPDRSNADNIMMKLDSGTKFNIIGWKRVPKPKSSESTESDDAPKAGTAPQSGRNKRNNEAPKVPEEENELWYKVHLAKEISPAPAGWIYGKQVELALPPDIIFYRSAREIVAWQKLETDNKQINQSTRNIDSVREAKPGSWVILEKSNSTEPKKLDEPDFDRLFVLGYNSKSEEHYIAYRSPDLVGHLPMSVNTESRPMIVTLRLQGEDNQVKEVKFKIRQNDNEDLKVEAPDLPKIKRKR